MLRVSAVVAMLFQLYSLTLLARIILSWVQAVVHIDPYNPVVRFIYDMTEPVMRPFRQILPPIGGLDLSPILLFMLLNWVANMLVSTLRGLGL